MGLFGRIDVLDGGCFLVDEEVHPSQKGLQDEQALLTWIYVIA
jgi:hypothetical protein